jgi:hypothetical protein
MAEIDTAAARVGPRGGRRQPCPGVTLSNENAPSRPGQLHSRAQRPSAPHGLPTAACRPIPATFDGPTVRCAGAR